MSVRSSQTIVVEFTTCRFDTGAVANADSTPTGTLVVNGTDNGATVTITNVDTGRYKASVTLPTLSVGDIVELSIAATVNSVSGKAIVWRDTKDVVIDSAGLVDANAVKLGPTGAGTAQTARDIGASVIVASNNDKTGYALTSSERDSVAAALLDLSNGIETSVTPRQAIRAIASILAGIISGGGTGTEVFKAISAASGGTTRVTVTVDSSGNRSAVTLNL